ncbi:hypothetical protein [Fibrobacter sp.]|uniref:hypothetical protein n=1 Tax=Fibrobacter sp. TaxID=35828 RepID=UPI00388FD887
MKIDAVNYLRSLDKEGITASLKKMRDALKPVESLNNLDDYKNYLTDIIKYYPLIQIMPLNFFERFMSHHPNITKLSGADLKKEFYSTGKSKKSFSNMIISRMRYSIDAKGLSAKNLIAPFLKDYGFNVCVYCNQSLIRYNSNNIIDTGTLDHFYNKDRYPFLCTSFFNFVPCCGECNSRRRKGERRMGFMSYREEEYIKGSPFKFTFDINAFGKFCYENDVNLDFSEDPNMGDLDTLETYNEVFKISSDYQSYKYMVCGVINNEYFQSIEQNNTAEAVSNGRLKPDPGRVGNILGVYSLDEKDIHKRLYMKLLLDLGKHLKWIP